MAETPVAPFSLDIANAESQNWGKAEWLTYFRDRLVKMRSRRPDAEYDNYENQTNAVSFYDNDGVLQVNVPLEKTLKEIYMGRTEGRVNFDIVPDGQADVDELQPSKYALTFFLDGNGRDNFWRENKLFRDWKATYGHCIWFTGLRKSVDTRYVLKEGEAVESDADLFAEGKFEKIENETWFFFPKAVHPKDFYVDDAAYGQPDMQYAEDCIMKEKVTMSEFLSRYGNSPLYDVDGVTYWQDINPKNKDDKPVDQRLIVLYHYFHRRSKKYLIVANEMKVVYDGIYLYDDGKLPFVNVQHYSNPNYFPGEGIPKRVAYLKAYKSEVFQDILAGSAMSSGLHLVVGNDDQIGQDWTLGGRQMNVWRTTGGADKVQQINTSPNLGYFTSVLELIDKEVVMNSGDNPMDTVDPGSDKVGIVEIMESNKSVRRRSVDENYNMGLDDALTMTLARIKQFAPALLAKKVKDSSGKLLKTIFPSIRIEGYVVEKKQGKQTFTEDLGKFGYFELKPGVVQGVGVKIVTPSTNSVMPILERQKVNEYVQNLSNLGAVAQMDPTGEMQRKLIERFPLEDVIAWMADAYGYDPDGLKANTKKDEIRKENLKKIDELKQLLSIQPPEQNAQMAPGAPGAAPAPQPAPAMPAG